MFKFFKNSTKFPKEKNKDLIWQVGDRLHYLNHGNEEQVNLTKLRYAYVQLLAGEPYLFLFDDHQHYIPASSQGFSKIYPMLSQQFGFDDQLFFDTIKKKEDCKTKIWIRPQECNYKILDENFDDDSEGFEVYTEPKQFISWDITYTDLEHLHVGHRYTSAYGTPYFKFDYPVRIGNLWLDEENYHADDYGYEREDQCYLSFDFGNQISSSICYTYDDENGYDDGGTSLHFYNQRVYPALLENPVYEQQIEITELVKLKNNWDIKQDVRKNAAVKHIPTGVKQQLGKSSGIWFDRKNNKIGFAGRETSIIFDIDTIEFFEINNALPAKGAGYALLRINLTNGNYYYIFEANTYELDPYAAKLASWTNRKVTIPEAYYNC